MSWHIVPVSGEAVTEYGGSMIVRPIKMSYKRAVKMISRLWRQSRELNEKSESPETGNWVTALNRT